MQFDDQTNSGFKNDDIPTNSSIYSLVLPDLGLVWPFETMRFVFLGGVQNPDHPRGFSWVFQVRNMTMKVEVSNSQWENLHFKRFMMGPNIS